MSGVPITNKRKLDEAFPGEKSTQASSKKRLMGGAFPSSDASAAANDCIMLSSEDMTFVSPTTPVTYNYDDLFRKNHESEESVV